MLIKNNMFSLIKYIIPFIMLMLVAVKQTAFATCDAAIYNTSNSSFTVKFTSDQGYYGNVDFVNIDPKQCSAISSESGSVENGPCIISPHQIVQIHYTTWLDEISGTIQLTNNLNESSANIHFTDHKDGGCPKFDTAPPSNVLVDSPSHGFVIIR